MPATAERLRLPPAASIFVCSRVAIWAVALYAWFWLVPRPPNARDLGFATSIWARADSGWFLAIAQHGYQRNGSAVFYPLYPLLVGVLGRAFGGFYVTAGVVVSLACCAAAFQLLYRIALPRLDEDGARRTVLYLAFFPMAVFLGAVYSESLYLLCALAAFVLAERRRWLAAGVVTGLAMLTRLSGVAVLIAIALIAWRSPDRRRALASLGVAPVLAGLYPLWLELRLRAPFAEFSNEAGWGRHLSYAGPLGGLWHGLQAAWAGVEQIVSGDHTHTYWPSAHGADPLHVAAHNLEDFAFLALFVVLGVAAWRRFGAPYGLFVLASLAIPLSGPTGGYPLVSMPRYCLPLFPAYMALAAFASTVRRDRFVLATSAMLLGAVAIEWSIGQWVS